MIDKMIGAVKNGWDMPPLIVHYQDGVYHPYDGRHRIEALRKMGITQVMVIIVVNNYD